MKRLAYTLSAALLVVSLLLAACAKPAPSPAPAPKPTVTATPTAAPKASPTPTAAPVGTPQYGGILKVAAGNTPRSIHPEPSTIQNWYTKAAYDTLLRLDEKGELQPRLATDWKLSPDKKSLTLTLRKGVKFHDGTDLNADAVKFSLEIRKAGKRGDYEEVTSIDIVDDLTVRLNLAKFQNTLFTSLWFIGGMITSPTAYKKFGSEQAQWNPVGTGSFKFVKYEQNTIIKYERFDAYWEKGKPYLDGFESYIIPDATTRELALRKGEIHSYEGVTPDVALKLEKDGFPLMKGPAEIYNLMTGDSVNRDSPWSNKKVREAAEYAIDREAIVKALGFGQMEALYQMTPSGTYAYIPDFKGRTYDPARAKQLLTEAGYPTGFKTTIIDRAPGPGAAVLAAATNLKEVGIDVTFDMVDAARYLQISQGGWKNGLLVRAFRDPPDWIQFVNTYTASTALESKSVLRPAGYDDLLAEVLLASDMASKRTAAQQVVRKAYDEALAIPLWATLRVIPRVKNAHNLEYFVPWGANKLWSPADAWLSK
ncbi:MAG: ABC transporter substrate-binding protein [Chloroflexi bacterium]|nr:ABC transporter substrate-binding protein [Chloroflexota bacterium]